MTGASQPYEPHPYIGGRNTALRALAAWRMEWPGTPRVVLVTGSPGSGRSRLVTGFRMLCETEHRARLPLNSLDPATVPPELPDPVVVDPTGLTAGQVLWNLAEASGIRASSTEDAFAQVRARSDPLTLLVPDVDDAGPVRYVDGPAQLVREVLTPLAALPHVRLVADLPRPLAAELAATLPPGGAQLIDLDAPQWADTEGLALQAAVLLDPEFGAPELPFTVDRDQRRAVADTLVTRTGARGGSRLTVRLAVASLLAAPDGFDPTDPEQLPATIDEVLALHARRVGVDLENLRPVLAALALAEGEGVPAELLTSLTNAVAERDMRKAVAQVLPLVGQFVESVETTDEEDGSARELLRLVHPALAASLRAGLSDVPAVQSRIAMALLEAVPEQDWSKADPYVRDHIAAHTLEAGLLPQLLTDPGLFTFADPVRLRACVEAVPADALGPPARTYLRTAPLLTRSGASERMRAALLETAFVEDGLVEHASALHELVPELPWRTLWSVPVSGVRELAVGRIPVPDGAVDPRTGDPLDASEALPVAVLGVPSGTPGAQLDGAGSAVLLRPLPRRVDRAVAPGGAGPAGGARPVGEVSGPAEPGGTSTEAAQVAWPTEDEKSASPLTLSPGPGPDHLRVRTREEERVVASLLSTEPFTSTYLSPEGVLLVSTERHAKALQIIPTR